MSEIATRGSGGRRLSVAYVVPGHNLLPSAGPTRNVLSLAAALGERADVTVAFRRVIERVEDDRFGIVEIDTRSASGSGVDDAALRGVGYGEFLRYLRVLRRFARERLVGHDVVLEKSWLLSGFVCRQCQGYGIPAIAVENLVPVADAAREGALKAARIRGGRWLAGHLLRRVPRIVAETEYLKADIVRRWRVDPDRVDVIGLGVDRDQFRPQDQAEARRRLGIPEEATVLLYVGVLDRAHDLRPVLRAVREVGGRSLHLIVVGDGALREELQAEARSVDGKGDRVWFFGRVPHDQVPAHIAAADLCLAPYSPAAFPGGVVGYSTLKVREYLAAGRPVATVTSGTLGELVEEGVTGFFVANETPAWRRLLGELPSRERLREMGVAAAQTPLWSWEDSAREYLSACVRVVHETREAQVAC